MNEPTILTAQHDASIGDIVVHVQPYRTKDRWGREVEVHTFYGNGGCTTAEGARIRKDGTPYARLQSMPVDIPNNVRKALGR